jgi:hypothetical protein
VLAMQTSGEIPGAGDSAECSQGQYWLLQAVASDGTYLSPAYVSVDCAEHPADITSEWYVHIAMQAAKHSLKIACWHVFLVM